MRKSPLATGREDAYRRKSASSKLQIPPSRLQSISIDNLLASVDQVPSARKRTPAVTFAGAPPTQSRDRRGQPLAIQARQSQPQRTTKTSEKVVFIPEADGVAGMDDSDDDDGPPKDEHAERNLKDDRPRRSVSERLTKERREERHLPRVTAYCVAETFRLQKTAAFLRASHQVKPRIYDDLLYAAYHLPLLPGSEEGCRVRSSPPLKTSEGENILDRQIEATEARDHGDEYIDAPPRDQETGDVRIEDRGANKDVQPYNDANDTAVADGDGEAPNKPSYRRRDSNPTAADLPAMYKYAEIFILSYGVVVFWNFSERQERNVLADLTFALSRTLMSRPLQDKDVETEEFHFEYSPNTLRPRIFNDMITLRSADHFVKMAMSHAIAQSVKLSLFEGRMDDSMAAAAHVPRKLAMTGELSMTRAQVMRMSGQLFKLRVDVNLSSNILDTPDFFWESEPTLNPLYTAVRDYLEIRTRTTLLNQRCQVVFDLLDILSESIADSNMHRITWIVIALILISVVVTAIEVSLRFALLQRQKHR